MRAVQLVTGAKNAADAGLPAGVLETISEGGKITPEQAKALGEYAAGAVAVGTNLRASAQYRQELIRVLVKRACLAL